jgi:hypothetical protein
MAGWLDERGDEDGYTASMTTAAAARRATAKP